jgi:hypothetical protein
MARKRAPKVLVCASDFAAGVVGINEQSDTGSNAQRSCDEVLRDARRAIQFLGRETLISCGNLFRNGER